MLASVGRRAKAKALVDNEAATAKALSRGQELGRVSTRAPALSLRGGVRARARAFVGDRGLNVPRGGTRSRPAISSRVRKWARPSGRHKAPARASPRGREV